MLHALLAFPCVRDSALVVHTHLHSPLASLLPLMPPLPVLQVINMAKMMREQEMWLEERRRAATMLQARVRGQQQRCKGADGCTGARATPPAEHCGAGIDIAVQQQPSSWERRAAADGSGRTFFYNIDSGESRWTL